ncbi:DUF2306 domain-containing protein [Phycicoccus sp.]|uniref:DUF2306 domain-containing protein n=1 Tax=Phycicoccus sp. TaxID=1902410 RepID=UPI002BB358A7|nr:DUF2306 domain-containing protein [Phycicoccus sp.]HMM94995.1 DUF2306 domain-containing protein [Phycicoccus sp.]
MTTTVRTPTGRHPGAGWRVALALVALSAIPLGAGTLRLVQLAGGPDLVPADVRFAGFPAALVVHIVASAVFALAGVLQLVASFRRRHLTWHRRSGRVLAACGLVVAGSALWLTLGYPPRPGTGPVLFVARLLVASGMAASIVLGFRAIRRQDVDAHRAWMVRAYALGLGAGTQAFTEGLTEAVVGTGELSGDLAKLAGWLVNLGVAELAIRRTRAAASPRRSR